MKLAEALIKKFNEESDSQLKKKTEDAKRQMDRVHNDAKKEADKNGFNYRYYKLKIEEMEWKIDYYDDLVKLEKENIAKNKGDSDKLEAIKKRIETYEFMSSDSLEKRDGYKKKLKDVN